MEEFAIGNSRQQDIMNLLEENNSLTVKDIANKLGVSLVTVRRDLAILQKYNMVRASLKTSCNIRPNMI